MTVEPAIVNALRAEPLLTDTFDVRRLPPAPTAQTGHFEGAFNERTPRVIGRPWR
jgi:hypothetical protein